MRNFKNIDDFTYDDIPQEIKICDAPGCNEHGDHKAPKSRDMERDYYWFCLDHAREYNKRWDYFDGMGREEIEAFMRDAETGHRPTWKTTERCSSTTDDLKHAVHHMFGDQFGHGRNDSPSRHDIDPELHKALAVLDIDYPVTHEELKLQYKKLVKKHHPDSARSGKHSEEAFKNITQAYKEALKLLKKEGH